jgi:hypothetical protein
LTPANQFHHLYSNDSVQQFISQKFSLSQLSSFFILSVLLAATPYAGAAVVREFYRQMVSGLSHTIHGAFLPLPIRMWDLKGDSMTDGSYFYITPGGAFFRLRKIDLVIPAVIILRAYVALI